MKKDLGVCWDQMKKLRSNSLCSSCSGINYLYYQDLRGGLSMSNCDAIFGKCQPFFAHLMCLWTPVILNYNILGKMDPKFVYEVNPNRDYNAEYRLRKLMNSWHAYQDPVMRQKSRA